MLPCVVHHHLILFSVSYCMCMAVTGFPYAISVCIMYKMPFPEYHVLVARDSAVMEKNK